jgi:restriction system protein
MPDHAGDRALCSWSWRLAITPHIKQMRDVGSNIGTRGAGTEPLWGSGGEWQDAGVAPSARRDMPTYRELIYPTLRAVASLGGSAQGGEVTDALTELLGATPEQLAVTYDGRPKSVLIDRMEWARSYAKLGGALDSPRRGLYVLTNLGKGILSLPEDEARAQLAQLDRDVRAARRRRDPVGEDRDRPDNEAGIGDATADASGEDDSSWKEALLARLHRLSPAGFEEFTLYLLRTFGLELTRVGGVGDEGIDGIGLAPISAVLSSRVAVQAKRYDPTTTIGRDVVALFQRDAAAAGAERAVLVTLARFSPAARKAATVTTPTVDLIDGDKLCELMRDQEVGLRIVPQVDESWFGRFGA